MWRALVVLVLSASSALAANLYVNANNPQGYATIAEAVRRSQAGDVIYISEGFYAEQISLEKKVSLIGEGADRVTVSFAQSGNAIDISAAVDTTAHIEGITVIGKGGLGVAVASGGGVTLRSCVIRGCGAHAIALSGGVSVVQQCKMLENKGGALYIYADQGSIITNNIITDNTGGISASWYGNAVVLLQENPGRALFANNLLKGNPSANAALMCLGGAPTIRNNVIVENNPGGYGIEALASTAPTISSNVVMANGYGIYQDNSSAVITYNDVLDNSAGDYMGSAADDMGGINQDPEFLNPRTNDYHLQPTSVCIDAGMPGAVYADPDGSRNDIGIYGGPHAALWVEPYAGPVVTSLEVSPASVQQGGTITVRATGTTVHR